MRRERERKEREIRRVGEQGGEEKGLERKGEEKGEEDGKADEGTETAVGSWKKKEETGWKSMKR